MCRGVMRIGAQLENFSMATILDFPSTDFVLAGQNLRTARTNSRLSLAQAATALGISPTTLDSWEQGRKPQLTDETAKARYADFRKDTNNCRNTGNNLLFGVFPIRIAREILDFSVEEMAKELGYSVSSWSKMESNARLVPKDKITELERRVSIAWHNACEGALP